MVTSTKIRRVLLEGLLEDKKILDTMTGVLKSPQKMDPKYLDRVSDFILLYFFNW